ncbi:MAG: DUF5320 domain-containing protein [Nitrososphaerales archaeon]
MDWRRGYGIGPARWVGPWPGRGPFSHLPPWDRPRWRSGQGRGMCWWWTGMYRSITQYTTPYWMPPMSKEDEIAMLEDEVKMQEQRLESIRKRLEELKK